MILLEDTIRINATPESIFTWLDHFPENYCAWHPDHVSCRYTSGNSMQVGSILRCEEYLHGKSHTMTLQLTHIRPLERVEYRMGRIGGGAFEVRPAAVGVDFVAQVWLGSRLPVLGAFLDSVVRLLFAGRLDMLRKHMTEEGRNLKQQLE